MNTTRPANTNAAPNALYCAYVRLERGYYGTMQPNRKDAVSTLISAINNNRTFNPYDWQPFAFPGCSPETIQVVQRHESDDLGSHWNVTPMQVEFLRFTAQDV